MIGDVPAAALRLMATCPVREHRASEPSLKTRGLKPGTMPAVNRGKRGAIKSSGEHGGQNRQSVIVDGKEYCSLKSAAKSIGISYHTLRHWLAQGRIQRAVRQS